MCRLSVYLSIYLYLYLSVSICLSVYIYIYIHQDISMDRIGAGSRLSSLPNTLCTEVLTRRVLGGGSKLTSVELQMKTCSYSGCKLIVMTFKIHFLKLCVTYSCFYGQRKVF
jgi:hypothetical protein